MPFPEPYLWQDVHAMVTKLNCHRKQLGIALQECLQGRFSGPCLQQCVQFVELCATWRSVELELL